MRVLGALAAATAVMGVAHAGEVRVTLEGVEARPGQVYAVLQSEAQFMQPAASYFDAKAAPSARGALTFVFPNVAPGDYVLSALHDEDSDQQMKRAPNGMPLEGWAMSNGRSLTGPPTFAVTKFTVGAAPVALTEPMTYPAAP